MLISVHISDERLLAHLDGELGTREAARVRKHLAGCSACQERARRVRRAFSDWEAAAAGESRDDESAAASRALLKARLAEAEDIFPTKTWLHPRLARSMAYACALALLIAVGVRVSLLAMRSHEVASSRPLPDPRMTPGATRAVSVSELCSADGDAGLRSVPVQLQQQVFAAYGIGGISTSDFEVDYLITPGLGGSEDVRNLWPEPHSNTMWNSYVKDQLEDHLHRMVCGNKLGLNEAQREIAGDWIAAYKKYFHTDQPLAASQPHSVASL